MNPKKRTSSLSLSRVLANVMAIRCGWLRPPIRHCEGAKRRRQSIFVYGGVLKTIGLLAPLRNGRLGPMSAQLTPLIRRPSTNPAGIVAKTPAMTLCVVIRLLDGSTAPSRPSYFRSGPRPKQAGPAHSVIRAMSIANLLRGHSTNSGQMSICSIRRQYQGISKKLILAARGATDT